MLRSLQTGGVGQTLMGGIVVSIIVVFILEFRAASRVQTGSIRRECAVSIAGDCFTVKDYNAEYGLVVPRGVPQKQVKAYDLRRQVLDGLIERELLVEDAHRLGLDVSEEDVKDELRLGRAHASLPVASALRLGYMLDLVSADESGIVRDLVRDLPIIDSKTQQIDDDLYARVVRSMTLRSPKEFVKMQARELLAARMRDLVRSRVRVSPEEAFNAFERDKSKAVVRFVRLDTDWFTRWSADDSDAAIDKWASENKAAVDEAWKTAAPKWKAGCPLVSEIAATFAADATEADKTLLKDKMDRAKSLVDKGQRFGAVARELSDGASAAVGGRLGCLTAAGYGDGGDVLVKAASALASGATSAVLETKTGYRVIRLDRTAPADFEALGRRTVARPLALRAEGKARAKDYATRLIEAAKGGARLDDTVSKLSAEFTAASPVAIPNATKGTGGNATDATGADADEPPARADPHAPKVEVSAPFNADGDPIPGAFGTPVAKMAFELAKPDDVRPEPIPVMGGLAVLQLKEKTIATRQDFAAAKDEITKRLEIAKQTDALTSYVARLRRAKKDKIAIDERILEAPKSADQD